MGVILNRKLHKAYPDTFCGVIEQRKQFSYRNHLAPSQRLQIKPGASEKDEEYLVHQLALEAVTGQFTNPLQVGTIFYHTDAVNPIWNRGMKVTNVIGSHKFFKPKEKK